MSHISGSIACVGMSADGSLVVVQHKCWVYPGDGRAIWSLPDIVEAMLLGTIVNWSSDVKRLLSYWKVLFERLGLVFEQEHEKSVRQVGGVLQKWGGALCGATSPIDYSHTTLSRLSGNAFIPFTSIHCEVVYHLGEGVKANERTREAQTISTIGLLLILAWWFNFRRKREDRHRAEAVAMGVLTRCWSSHHDCDVAVAQALHDHRLVCREGNAGDGMCAHLSAAATSASRALEMRARLRCVFFALVKSAFS